MNRHHPAKPASVYRKPKDGRFPPDVPGVWSFIKVPAAAQGFSYAEAYDETLPMLTRIEERIDYLMTCPAVKLIEAPADQVERKRRTYHEQVRDLYLQIPPPEVEATAFDHWLELPEKPPLFQVEEGFR